LSEIDMDGFVLRYVLVKWIRVLNRAVFYTGRTTCALVLQNIPGLSNQGDPEVPCFSFYTVNVSIGQDLYVGMPADLDQFRRKNSYRAVIGGKGLVKLGHVAANGRRLVHQIDLKTRSGKIKGSLDPADSPTDDHDIPKMTALETFAHTVCEASTNPVLNFFQFSFHFPSPYQASSAPASAPTALPGRSL
jgi:hypothetical protein